MHSTAILCAGLLASTAASLINNTLTPEKLVADIHQKLLRESINDLSEIAEQNGGNRAFGFPGFDASVDYILEDLGDSSGKIDINIQSFTHIFSTTRSISLTGPNQEVVPVISLQYNHPTPSNCGVTAPLLHFPIDDDQGTGCTEDQWDSVDGLEGKIPLIMRSNKCHFITILKLAKDRGAPAVIIYNNTPGVTGGSASLGAGNQGTLAPVGVITFEQGTAWAEQLGRNESVAVNLNIDVLTEERETRQVLIETKDGDPDNIIMLGAHLDSVQEGPGINDNASGVVGLLAIIKSLVRYSGIKNKVRFAFWAAEESGMIGSLHYTSTLSKEDVEKIRFYFNYDMIASPNPVYMVYADTDSHKVGAQLLHDFLVEQSQPAEIVPFGSSSDYIGFLELGIPSSGIFTGAGAPHDSCYHSSCDGSENMNWDALTVNVKAAAYAAAQLARSPAEDFPAHDTASMNPRSKRGAARNLARWANMARGAEKSHSCGDLH